MEKKLKDSVFRWIKSAPNELAFAKEQYCQTRDVFQARLDTMIQVLLRSSKIEEGKIYILVAIVGEIGNNSFDHNLGNWRDIHGILFNVDLKNRTLYIKLPFILKNKIHEI